MKVFFIKSFVVSSISLLTLSLPCSGSSSPITPEDLNLLSSSSKPSSTPPSSTDDFLGLLSSPVSSTPKNPGKLLIKEEETNTDTEDKNPLSSFLNTAATPSGKVETPDNPLKAKTLWLNNPELFQPLNIFFQALDINRALNGLKNSLKDDTSCSQLAIAEIKFRKDYLQATLKATNERATKINTKSGNKKAAASLERPADTYKHTLSDLNKQLNEAQGGDTGIAMRNSLTKNTKKWALTVIGYFDATKPINEWTYFESYEPQMKFLYYFLYSYLNAQKTSSAQPCSVEEFLKDIRNIRKSVKT